LNFEFSLAEVLERLIPGAIFASTLMYIADTDLSKFTSDSSIPIFDRKAYWDSSEGHVANIKSAVADYFKVDPTEDSWKLCYGVCHKHDYTVKSELFARLNVFCRSMSICSFVLSILFILKSFLDGADFMDWAPKFLLFLVACYSFYRGARLYSRSFVGSIYEGFYSFYSEKKS
jgi:hypothetical protein